MADGECCNLKLSQIAGLSLFVLNFTRKEFAIRHTQIRKFV
jgi:hypothetical protein